MKSEGERERRYLNDTFIYVLMKFQQFVSRYARTVANALNQNNASVQRDSRVRIVSKM